MANGHKAAPCPGAHLERRQRYRYRFTVYVLDTALALSADSDKEAVLKAMEGHILQTGSLYEKYQKKHK